MRGRWIQREAGRQGETEREERKALVESKKRERKKGEMDILDAPCDFVDDYIMCMIHESVCARIHSGSSRNNKILALYDLNASSNFYSLNGRFNYFP